MSVWFPLLIPRSEETSKTTASVGARSEIRERRTRTFSPHIPTNWRPTRSAAGTPSRGRFWRASPSILAKLDLPEPKKPEIQTPTPSWGRVYVSL